MTMGFRGVQEERAEVQEHGLDARMLQEWGWGSLSEDLPIGRQPLHGGCSSWVPLLATTISASAGDRRRLPSQRAQPLTGTTQQPSTL